MPRDRIVPLIMAVALSMESMDSTVIATSLPAIAADIGTNPGAQACGHVLPAITSHLHPGQRLERPTGSVPAHCSERLRAAIAIFVLGSIGCSLASSLMDFVIARIVQGIGSAMMTPVGRTVLVRTISKRDLVGAWSG